jgi:His/Glu/Gln/Arg/opine family amino acid ABC transporter permease subunit
MSIISDPRYAELIWRGFLMTVFLSTTVIVVSNVAAYLLAIYMLRPTARFRRVVIGYSLFARAAPVLALLFLLYYGLPRAGIYLEPVVAALAGLVFASTAYNLEFLRSGFEGVKPGQSEAATALGLKSHWVVWKIMTPQAYAVAAPALFSNAIQMIKGSSLASLVTIAELTSASTTIIAETYRAMEVLFVISILYMLLCGALIALQHVYENRRRWKVS